MDRLDVDPSAIPRGLGTCSDHGRRPDGSLLKAHRNRGEGEPRTGPGRCATRTG